MVLLLPNINLPIIAPQPNKSFLCNIHCTKCTLCSLYFIELFYFSRDKRTFLSLYMVSRLYKERSLEKKHYV